MLFSLAALEIFLFITNFQQSDYECASGFFSSLSSLLSFLDMCFYSFLSNLENDLPLLLKVFLFFFFGFPSFSQPPYSVLQLLFFFFSHSVVSNSLQPHGLQLTRLLRPWDFPGKSTGVGCNCLLQLGTSQFQSLHT